MYRVVDVVKCFVVYYILFTLYSQQTPLLVNHAIDTNIVLQTFGYIFHVLQVKRGQLLSVR